MEANLDYGICSHITLVKNTLNPKKNHLVPKIAKDMILTLEDFILANLKANSSLVFRKEYVN